ncbi:MAG: tRNA (adenosine(37)-N6)-threonylcarbamoyltransferase complex transferase subunit TsaD [Proteobacteria bacterium]|nr:tRNA (adenosine(37)-N6)-threonylcarbamoyltransferase complex transferase subunit TsaD [Pseudomonadota bacterium]
MRVLGIETSCDETAAAVIDGDAPVGARLLSNVVLSQLDEHRPYGGVVPEIAARAHIDHLDRLVAQAMDEAWLGFSDLDGIAVTSGPGLIGGVMVGLMTAKAIASASNVPLIAVNHLEAHALSVRLTDDVAFPYLLLLVSGGHCQLQIVEGVGTYTRLGTTIDDAVGEAFDKSAKLMGLGYPGGPAVEQAARSGDPTRFDLPRPLLRQNNCHFSLSGLKTAVLRAYESLGDAPTDQDRADLSACFQVAVGDVLADRSRRAMEIFTDPDRGQKNGADADPLGRGEVGRPLVPGRDGNSFVIAGGVAANAFLRDRLSSLCDEQGFNLVCPPPALCTDNGAMIAWAGIERLRLGLTDPLTVPARARWPLDPNAPPAIGAGVKA